MPRKLLISDANILIDMEVGGLLDKMFKLEYEFGVPDILYEQELRERHPQLEGLGLRSLELTPESVARVVSLAAQYRNFGVSTNDLFALVLSQQEQTTLLTGDAKLKQACIAEKISVRGTVWLVGEMLEAAVIEYKIVNTAYEAMRNSGRRLPWKDVEKQLRKYHQ
jgi:hypothetical protein